MKKIIHIDMDAFFASVEQRDNPELRGKPIAVARDTVRNVVSTASYEARRYGVRSALSVAKAKRLCPRLILVPPRHDVYKKVSAQIREIFLRYTDLVEPLSLDEAYLDVTHSPSGKTATQIAREIRAAIRKELGLTASAGVSFNKFLAKIASDLRKPDGLSRILPKDAPAFLDSLSVENFFGVGPATAKKMHALGIFTGKDLRERTREELTEHFGKTGAWFYEIVRGNDLREVEPNRERISLGVEDTFPHDLTGADACAEELKIIAKELERRLSRANFSGYTLTLKIKFSDFTQMTRSRTRDYVFSDTEDLWRTAKMLLEEHLPSKKPVRLLGITISNAAPLVPAPVAKKANSRSRTDDRQLTLPI
ncbi:MAG: DNA polymerase IV [Opitutales bacterium]|nr:DNA polymerase IV [Opitutales bacterium]